MEVMLVGEAAGQPPVSQEPPAEIRSVRSSRASRGRGAALGLAGGPVPASNPAPQPAGRDKYC